MATKNRTLKAHIIIGKFSLPMLSQSQHKPQLKNLIDREPGQDHEQDEQDTG